MTFGSLTGAAREAVGELTRAGHAVRLIAPRLLSPVRPDDMAAAFEGVRRLLVVEQTHSAQFHRYLKAHYTLPADTVVLNRAGPLPIRPGEICRALLEGGNS
jgi:2-oxoglutarate ferredoxin oxidoreductase subunit alpha